MNRSKNLLCLAALLAAPQTAAAATVTPSEQVVFSFELSDLSALQITGSAFACFYASYCFDDGGLLATGARLQISYGTTPNGAELGSRFFANTFATPINNAAGNVATSPDVFVPADTDTVYATFGYIDDVYSVEEFRLFTTLGTLEGTALPSAPPSAVPLGATHWPLMLGLITIGGIKVRAQRLQA